MILKREKIFSVILLLVIFCLAFVLRFIPFIEYDLRLLTNGSDNWWFLGMARYFAIYHTIPEIEPTYGNGIPYLYPPGLMLIFAVLAQLSGIELVYLGKFGAILLGSFTVILVYILAKRLTNDYKVGLLASVLIASSVRYIAQTANFCSELFGHLLIPVILYFLYRGIKENSNKNLFVGGLLFAGLIISHHLSSAIMIVSLIFFTFLLLIFRRKKSFNLIKKVLLVTVIGFIISFPFWLDLLDQGILNIAAKEGYGNRNFRDLIKMSYYYIGIPQIFLGILGIVYALYKRKIRYLLFLGFIVPLLFCLYDREIANFLFSKNLFRANPDFIYFFSPTVYTRYFNFITLPLVILGAMSFFSIFRYLEKMTKRLKIHSSVLLILMWVCVGLILITMPLPMNSKTIYENSGYKWLEWKIFSFISLEEYEAAIWMRENLPDNVNILSDYEANEMILGVTAKTVANGGTLRATLPVATIYTDHLTIYFTSNLKEALRLIKKYKITHIFLSKRMEEKAWFCVSDNARFNYSYGSSMKNADLKKFENSDCFKKIYDKNGVKIYKADHNCKLLEK